MKKKRQLIKALEGAFYERWLPEYYQLDLSTGGWVLMRQDRLYYLGKPTTKVKVEFVSLLHQQKGGGERCVLL